MTRIRIVVAVALWLAAGVAIDATRARRVETWIDLPEVLARGTPACLTACSWGLRCRWEGSPRAALQHAVDGCGPAALQAILRHGDPAPPQDLLWSICRRPGGGTTLGALARAARCFGQRPQLVWDPGLERVALPAIVHLKRGHFVVLERRGSLCVRVFDPACGYVRMPWPVLRAAASGAALEFDLRPRAARCGPPAPVEVVS